MTTFAKASYVDGQAKSSHDKPKLLDLPLSHRRPRIGSVLSNETSGMEVDVGFLTRSAGHRGLERSRLPTDFGVTESIQLLLGEFLLGHRVGGSVSEVLRVTGKHCESKGWSWRATSEAYHASGPAFRLPGPQGHGRTINPCQ